MQDQPIEEAKQRPQATAAAPRKRTSPSSSRMLASYLAEIEQLLDAQRLDAALRDACDLPCIAVALADPRLRCAAEQVRTWSEEWIRPPGAERDAHGLDYQRLGRQIIDCVLPPAGDEVVPMRALRRLQLRRHARTPPRGFSGRRAQHLPPRDTETVEICTALLEAARRWYARCAVHDPAVQANLARLAVLR